MLEKSIILGLLILLLIPQHLVFADEFSISENKILAAFIFNISKFIEWKDRPKLKTLSEKINFGVFKNPSLLNELTSLSTGKKIQEHPTQVNPISENGFSASSMDVLVLIPQNGQFPSEMAKKLKNNHCLTISYSNQRDPNSIVINFFKENDHLRFEINPKVAQAEKIEINSQLFKLGKLMNED